MNRVMPDHYIIAISYADDYLECACGKQMRAEPRRGDWVAHRRELGLKVKNVSETIGKRLAPAPEPRTIAREASAHRLEGAARG